MKILLFWLALNALILATLWLIHAKFPDLWEREIVGDESETVREKELELRREEAKREGLL